MIGDAGLTALAHAITPVSAGGSGALPCVQVIELQANIIGDDGITKLAEALRKGALARVLEQVSRTRAATRSHP